MYAEITLKVENCGLQIRRQAWKLLHITTGLKSFVFFLSALTLSCLALAFRTQGKCFPTKFLVANH